MNTLMIDPSLSNPVLVCATNVHLALSGKNILNNINLSLHAGTVTALVGQNGAGKSHLLKCLHGIQSPTSGEISRAYDWHKMALVLQRPALLRRSAAENIALGLKVRDIGKSERATRITKALEQTEMGEFANKLATQLSVGQQQRLALAQALAIQPAVLLLDEVTSALDPQSISLVERLIRDQAKRGVSVFMVTQDLAQVGRLAQNVFTMVDGCLEPPLEAATFLEQFPNKP